MYNTLSNSIEALARWTALSGGFVLISVVVMTCLSISGRALGSFGFDMGPIQGDFEMVEMGVGFAIFSFLPWCQLRRGHATVDLFQARFSPRMNDIIDFISDVVMLVAAVLISWRLWIGMLDKKGYTETTFILQFPVWIAYAAAMLGAAVFVIVAAYCVLRAGRHLTGATND